MAGNYRNNERTAGTKCLFFEPRLFMGEFQQSKMPPPRCEQKIMRMTRHGDGGSFRGGEERTGGGILQGKQLSRGEEAALI